MSANRATRAAPAGGPSRIERARERAATARRGLAMAAVASFGVSLLLVRAWHPATASASAGLEPPAALVAEIGTPPIGGGSIGAATGAPAASTSTS